MNENITDHSLARIEAPEEISRRRFLEKLSITLGSFCAAVVGLPLIGFVIAPLFRKVPEQWVTLGKVNDFQIGKTVSVTVVNPSSLPWAGITALCGCVAKVKPSLPPSRLTAPTSVAQCDGWREPNCSCVRATAASTTKMGTLPPVHPRCRSFATACASKTAK